MSHEKTVAKISTALSETFSEVDAWFDRPKDLRSFRPEENAWSIDEVLEHISIVTRFLLLTLNKQLKVAEKRSERGDETTGTESDLSLLDDIANPESFEWNRPDHMIPTGKVPIESVRSKLKEQLDECLMILERLREGVGGLRKVTMTVNDLGKIDLYQWLYFIAQHAKRHLKQMAKNEARYEKRLA